MQDGEETAQRKDKQGDQEMSHGAHANGQHEAAQARKRSNPAVHDVSEAVKGKKARSSARDKSAGSAGDLEKSDTGNGDKSGDVCVEGKAGVPRAVRWVFARLSHIARKSGGDRRTCVFRYVC